MTSFIRKLPTTVEFCLVVFVCAWWGIYASIVAIANHSWSAASQSPERFTGIGIMLAEQGDTVIIAEVVSNTPAARAGLSPGLIIRKIDGASTEGKSIPDCMAMARGPAGSKVRFELVDATENRTNTVELTRAWIRGSAQRISVTNHSAVEMVSFELLGLAVTYWIARIRGWPLATWGFQPSWKLTGAGVILCLGTILMAGVTSALINLGHPGTVHRYLAGHLGLPWLIVLVVVNPFFEEVLEVGYFVQTLQRHGMWITVLASACFRAFLHSYQGINAIVLIFPLGLVFGFVYWKWRRLWPLYMAHVILDFCAFVPKLHGG